MNNWYNVSDIYVFYLEDNNKEKVLFKIVNELGMSYLFILII